MESEFTPRRLYIKQHSVTGMRYFGQTVSEDIDKYKGSGTYWVRHIKKHGVEHVINEWISEWFYEPETISDFALEFSEQYDIVNSKEWANLIPEDGLGGWDRFNDIRGNYDEDLAFIRMKENGTYEGWLEKITIASTGENNPAYGTKWIFNPDIPNSSKLLYSGEELPEGYLFGMDFERRQKMVESNVGKNLGSKLYYNPETLETVRIQLNQQIPEGYINGIGMTEEQRTEWSGDRSGENNGNYGKHPYYNYETDEIMYFESDETAQEGFTKGLPSTQYNSIRGENNPKYGSDWYYHPVTMHEFLMNLKDKHLYPEYIKGRPSNSSDERKAKLKAARANSAISFKGQAQIVNINDSKDIKWFDVVNEYELPEGYKFRNEKNALKLKKRDV
jgi:hypothetical protein